MPAARRRTRKKERAVSRRGAIARHCLNPPRRRSTSVAVVVDIRWAGIALRLMDWPSTRQTTSGPTCGSSSRERAVDHINATDIQTLSRNHDPVFLEAGPGRMPSLADGYLDEPNVQSRALIQNAPAKDCPHGLQALAAASPSCYTGKIASRQNSSVHGLFGRAAGSSILSRSTSPSP